MPDVPNATEKKPFPGSERRLRLLIELEPWPRVFLRNLADLFRSSPPYVTTTRAGRYWADAWVERPAPWAAITRSFLLHLLAVVMVFALSQVWPSQPQITAAELERHRPLENYELTDYLPPVTPTPDSEKPKPPVRPKAQAPDPEYARQEIITINLEHNSTQQTIVNPPSPNVLKQDVPLPNIVAITPIAAAAPVAPNHPLNSLQLPELAPPVAEPSSAPAAHSLASLSLPEEQTAVAPPSATPANRRLADVNLAVDAPTVAEPRLSVVEQVNATGQQSKIGKAAGGPPPAPAPPVTAGNGKAQSQGLGQLVVLNARPITPNGPLQIPEGNRQGEFAAGPTGRPGASGKPEIAAGDNSPAAGPARASVTNIYVADPPRKVTAPVAVAAPAFKPDLPRTNGQDVPSSGKVEDRVFGDKRYYSMTLNMPNLSSGGGGSWIIRFAELNPLPGAAGEGLSAPVALNKVDPAYPAALVRDRVEGVVVLYAVIRSDGSVGDIRVLEGVHETLDANAQIALQKWHFRPGTKNGAPVDVEAVVKIPFKVARNPF